MKLRFLLTLMLGLGWAGVAVAQSDDGQGRRRGGEQVSVVRHSDITPYIELDQQFIATLKGGDDVLTYTGAAVGVQGEIATRTMQVAADVRYEHRIGWGKDLADADAISGIVRGRAKTLGEHLTIDGGALATRSSASFDGANAALTADKNSSEVYSAFVAPTLTAQEGPVTATATYRLGYNRIDDDTGVLLPGAGEGNVNLFDESVTHNVAAVIATRPGTVLPVGLAVSAGYDREDATQLDQRFEDSWVRGDVTVPLTDGLSAVGGIGHEKLEISQRDVARDEDGQPIVTPGGRLVEDRNAPRLLSYDFSGILWDAGVLWRPSSRTSLDARVGQRYGSWRVTGNFQWRPDRSSAVSVILFDGIDSFGRLTNATLSGLSPEFEASRNPFSGDLNSCMFASQGGAQCLNGSLTGVSGVNFRHRGIAAQYSRSYGPWDWGFGMGYARRRFIAPDSGVFADINGLVDENYYATVVATRRLDDASGVDGALYFNYYDTGLDGRRDTMNGSAYGSYFRNFGDRLSARASAGVNLIDAKGMESIIAALAQIGVRYEF